MKKTFLSLLIGITLVTSLAAPVSATAAVSHEHNDEYAATLLEIDWDSISIGDTVQISEYEYIVYEGKAITPRYIYCCNNPNWTNSIYVSHYPTYSGRGCDILNEPIKLCRSCNAMINNGSSYWTNQYPCRLGH